MNKRVGASIIAGGILLIAIVFQVINVFTTDERFGEYGFYVLRK